MRPPPPRPIVLMTRRLALVELAPDDAPFILELMTDPAWLTCIRERGVHTLADAERHLAEHLIPPYRREGFGLWRVELRERGEPIGLCGLVRRATLPGPDLAYALLPAWRGHGFAFEAAEAVVRYARDSLALDRLLAICRPDNTSSIRLLLALGMVGIDGPANDTGPPTRCFELPLRVASQAKGRRTGML